MNRIRSKFHQHETNNSLTQNKYFQHSHHNTQHTSNSYTCQMTGTETVRNMTQVFTETCREQKDNICLNRHDINGTISNDLLQQLKRNKISWPCHKYVIYTTIRCPANIQVSGRCDGTQHHWKHLPRAQILLNFINLFRIQINKYL